MTKELTPSDKGQFILFESADGRAQVECRFEAETLWLSQADLCSLYGKAKATISEHLSNIFSEDELVEDSVVRLFRTTASDGKSYNTKFYNLDVILAVGYRVRSKQGTQFRQWATQTLKEYLSKGFVMDDERLKSPESSQYFDELLNRIRDIRSSEKIFWRKVCDIYATSIDYDGKAQTSMYFFAQVQNKMHWAAHGHTAAELVFKRVDSDKPHLGLTSYQGQEPTRKEVVTAKNYLSEQELDTLNRIVTSYLEFAELQARQGKLMKMADWANKLDDFLQLSDFEILTHAGKVSSEQAKQKAKQEYDKFRRVIDAEPTQVDRDLLAAMKVLGKDNH
ncbi:virulence RhuM family protein [Vibrio hannami]|uniref:virulence RhuM family protein n=1 Tax=Vibrio hannami TaxID=2717094 RepID=UPI00241069F6|nr:virulence RhuM family protein [Vibrio hannami]MDG3085923.1 virulence RhuM family protein [Vibrio hannami]